MKDLDERLSRLVTALEKAGIEDYLRYAQDKKRMIVNSILSGMLRGLGFSLGFWVLGAAAIVILRHAVANNIPLISNFFAEVINEIQARM